MASLNSPGAKDAKREERCKPTMNGCPDYRSAQAQFDKSAPTVKEGVLSEGHESKFRLVGWYDKHHLNILEVYWVTC
jgi:hypothetical protein